MNRQSFLIFKVQDLRYALAVDGIREIFKLPELMAVANMPSDIIGLLNFRTQVLPVMHLAHRLGQGNLECQVSDSLVVLQWRDLWIGMVVNQVEEVIEIDRKSIKTNLSLGREQAINSAFLSGVATVDSEMIMLLNPEALIRQADKISESISELNLAALVESEQSTAGMLSIVKIDGEGEKETGLKSFFERYCTNASAAELAIFRQRAAMLQAPLETFQEEASNSLAVIRLGGEYFGIRLEVVREFIQISAMTPVPCCPSHILGNLNLRGEIMTVMGIHDYLNVASPQRAAEKAIVIEVNGIVAGVAADQVCDIVQLSQQQISPVPAATISSRKSYFSGIAPYGENVLGILDFSKLIQAERLVVNEAI